MNPDDLLVEEMRIVARHPEPADALRRILRGLVDQTEYSLNMRSRRALDDDAARDAALELRGELKALQELLDALDAVLKPSPKEKIMRLKREPD